MAKDKKGKSEGKKAKIEEKKKKQEKKGEKKEKTKKAKANDSDAEDVDLDAVLAEYAKKQEQFLKVTETTCDPPRARGSSTLIASPANDNELFLFGGEYFNGALATFFNDLHIYLINKDEWRIVTSPNTPLPRSGHAWCRGGNAGGIYLFGGEFSSPKQGTFYHYNDVSVVLTSGGSQITKHEMVLIFNSFGALNLLLENGQGSKPKANLLLREAGTV
jgi:hypothetical protein